MPRCYHITQEVPVNDRGRVVAPGRAWAWRHREKEYTDLALALRCARMWRREFGYLVEVSADGMPGSEEGWTLFATVNMDAIGRVWADSCQNIQEVPLL